MRSRVKVLSNVQADSMLKLLALYMHFYQVDEKITPKLKAQAATYYKDSIAWVKKTLGEDSASYEEAFKQYKKGVVDDDVMYEIVGSFKSNTKTILADKTLHSQDIELLKYWNSYMWSANENSGKKFVNSVGLLKDPFLNAAFIQDTNDQNKVMKKVQTLVKKLKGNGNALTIDQAKEMREKDPENYTKYLALRREAAEIWKTELRNIVRSSGDTTMDYADAVKQLERKKLSHGLTEGFVGRIDESGNLYTTDGDALAGGQMNGKITMNPTYDAAKGNWYYKVTLDTGTIQARRPLNAIKQDSKDRFSDVAKFQEDVPKIRQKWLVPMYGPLNKKAMTCLAVEMVYETQARIGASDKAGTTKTGTKQSTYGLLTTRAKHYSFKGNVLVIAYPGKSGVRQIHRISPRDKPSKGIIEKVKLLLEGKQPNDYLFEHDGTILKYKDVYIFLKSLGVPPKVTIHTFRKLKGNQIFLEALEKIKPPKTVTLKWVNDAVKKAATEVGKELGHVNRSQGKDKVTPATSLKAYIDHDLIRKFYDDHGQRVPKMFEKSKEM